jgi:hypothetical protein
MQTPTYHELENFAVNHGIKGVSRETLERVYDGSFKVDRAKRFLAFQNRLTNELLNHQVIRDNPYTRWFETAKLTEKDLRQFFVQFSVFSNLFLIAQLHKMLNAPTLEEMHASKEILVNELGVLFNSPPIGNSDHKDGEMSEFGEHKFKGLTGSAEGGTFRFKGAHFELLVRLASHVGLSFSQLGRREFGTPTTLHFCDELVRLYGSANYTTATAASYAVENWAAAGFWDQLVNGLKNYKTANNIEHFPMAFFTWHAQLEANHARHTQEELEQFYFANEFDEDYFIARGNEMLAAVYIFWEGLDSGRQQLH